MCRDIEIHYLCNCHASSSGALFKDFELLGTYRYPLRRNDGHCPLGRQLLRVYGELVCQICFDCFSHFYPIYFKWTSRFENLQLKREFGHKSLSLPADLREAHRTLFTLHKFYIAERVTRYMDTSSDPYKNYCHCDLHGDE